MPIRFALSTEQGDFPNAFARVLVLRIDRLARTVDVRGGVWVDSGAAGGDRVQVKRFGYVVQGQDYNQFFTQAALAPANTTPDSQAEEWLLTQADFAGGVRV